MHSLPVNTQLVFRDLNSSLGCSPLPVHTYSVQASTDVYNVMTFGVGQRTEGFLPLNPISVSLQSLPSRSALDYGQLRQEPAITALDWLFTPYPRLEEHLHVEPLQASTRFYSDFTLPRTRSSGFGSYSCDFLALSYHSPRKLRVIGFPMDAPCKRIILATQINSLARYSKRTIQRLNAVSHYSYLVSESFHSLLRVLFNFPSLYSYSIGLDVYLGLGVNATLIPAGYPTNSTLSTSTSSYIRIRDFHPVSYAIPGNFCSISSD